MFPQIDERRKGSTEATGYVRRRKQSRTISRNSQSSHIVCAEVLFEPTFRSDPSVHEMREQLFDVVKDCDKATCHDDPGGVQMPRTDGFHSIEQGTYVVSAKANFIVQQ